MGLFIRKVLANYIQSEVMPTLDKKQLESELRSPLTDLGAEKLKLAIIPSGKHKGQPALLFEIPGQTIGSHLGGKLIWNVWPGEKPGRLLWNSAYPPTGFYGGSKQDFLSHMTSEVKKGKLVLLARSLLDKANNDLTAAFKLAKQAGNKDWSLDDIEKALEDERALRRRNK